MPHIHDKIDFTAEVFVVHNNTVLLRRHDKYKIWLSVGGHIELDEDPNEAAVREVKEEVGIDVKIAGKALSFNEAENYKELIPPKFLNRHKVNHTHEHVTLVYFATCDSNKIIQSDHEISKELRWFTIGELDDPRYGILDSIKYYAKEAISDLS